MNLKLEYINFIFWFIMKSCYRRGVFYKLILSIRWKDRLKNGEIGRRESGEF